MLHRVWVVASILYVLAGSQVAGQTGAAAREPDAGQLQRANTLFANQDWEGALAAYRSLTSAHPNHALSRFRVGVALLRLNRFAEAEPNLREGERLGTPGSQAALRLAQAEAGLGHADSAVKELLRAASLGLFLPVSALNADPYLTSLQGHPRWAQVKEAFDAIVQPCRHDPRFREFDFWIGDWDVRPTGQPPAGPPARNTVTLDDNGCVVTEHWVAPSGSEGQSFNIFDRSIGKWRQTWVDNVGGQHDYRGSLQNGNMVFMGDTPAPNGQLGRVPTRLTFFHLASDSVRQFSETSSDSGRTWQVAYDLTYVRRKSGASGGSASPNGGAGLTDADRAAIRSLDSTFVRGWLADDTTLALSGFAPEAVLLPPGSVPVVGLSAIRAYWWPNDGSKTRILRFDRTIDEIGGGSDLAYFRGTGSLTWDYTKDGKTTSQQGRSADLVLLAKDGAGRWRVIRQIWNPLP